MPKHHLIIGGGPVATNAIEAIRQFDNAQSQITLVSDEPAHSRMALPYWLSGQIPREHTHTADDAYFSRLGVTARIGERVTALDAAAKTAQLSGGDSISFDDALIATGASPVGLDIPGIDLPGVSPLWSLSHVEQVLAAVGESSDPHVVMIGAGFIGFIVLNAMFKRGWRLTVVEREPQVLPRMLDRQGAEFVQQWLGGQGVAVHTGASVQAIETGDDGRKNVVLETGDRLPCDAVIVATGIQPNLELARGAGLDCEDGIVVDSQMRTSAADIYAGGDVAQGPMLLGGPNAIHAIQPTAVDHGRVAGANMAGQNVTYPGSLLMNVVDVCGLQTASFGHWDDESAETMTIANPGDSIYRKLLWTEDRITGAIFTGRASDLGMLNDVGMVKGIIQTQTPLGSWKKHLAENPFDIRRAYIGAKVAARLAGSTLLGQAARPRGFQFQGARPGPAVDEAHAAYVDTSR